jgi:NADPH:quinone reductase-like Zn-dependent oxidoreductase
MVKVCAAALNPLDLFLLKGAPWNSFIPGSRKPKEPILGCEIAGQVEARGRFAKKFRPGDEVFGATGFTGRGFADFVCVAEDKLVSKPANASFEEAAAVPIAASTALQGLRDKGHVQPGQKVLIEGASGGVGTFAIQLAKVFGAEVTAVCSTRHVETARSLGADHVIDYTQVDFARSVQRYDLILASYGDHSPLQYRRALNPNGTFVSVGGELPRILQAAVLWPILFAFGRRKLRFFVANMNQRDLGFLRDLLASRKLVPVIDRHYPLRDTADAFRYLAEGHAQGKVIITFAERGDS